MLTSTGLALITTELPTSKRSRWGFRFHAGGPTCFVIYSIVARDLNSNITRHVSQLMFNE
ncbi:hypothetical protein FHX77_000955 [Bifidobacterium commune]|uniref:Uncharacterized protein n=1 Tax=Bifidobacterium commune TaxID=1505727 RepID=A0A1C4H5C1_9BIFI|nr:hypothetical protein [Bifidobacterium commune]SCC79993.1 hypothetical protein GA0061077_0918 [Bifidobacterium commune]